jgi:4-carboxymuconolactone decarboxylase
VTDTIYKKGQTIRRAVLGDAHVDRAQKAATELDADFQDFITKTAWGSIWAREHLTRRERSMLTIAMLASLGHLEELALHLKATANTGTSMADVREVLMQVAVYAGIPAANAAFRVAKKHYAENDSTDDTPSERM